MLRCMVEVKGQDSVEMYRMVGGQKDRRELRCRMGEETDKHNETGLHETVKLEIC